MALWIDEPSLPATKAKLQSPSVLFVSFVVRAFSQHFHSFFLVSSQQESLQFLQEK